MSLLHDARFSSWARGHLVCRVEDVHDRFALTFDDGPNGRATAALLDLLDRHGAGATFFTLTGNVRRHPELTRRIAAAGHELAAHGDLHWPLPLMPRAWRLDEARRSAAAIAEITGTEPAHYRPAFGFMTPAQAAEVRALGMESVLGDVYPEDPHRPGVDRIVRRVLRRLRGGSILILHDGNPWGDTDRDQTISATAAILEWARQRGLSAVSVADLLGPLPPPATNGDAG
jgi:peptidoglycan-N-acetylglucosamine deacetylase